MSVKVTTNNVPRPVVDGWDLTPAEREQFGYLNWAALDAGEDSASFVRYKGELLDLGDFLRIDYPYFGEAVPDWQKGWDGIATDSFFSATVVRYVTGDDGVYPAYEYVVVGRVFS